MILSIVIPVYNVEKYLNDLFESLESIDFSGLEVIFVEDCSSDESYRVIESWIRGFKNRKSSISLISHEVNRGLSASRNTGISSSSGKYIWCVDSDDVINPECFNIVLECINKEDSDVITFDFSFFSESYCYILNKGAMRKEKRAHVWSPPKRQLKEGWSSDVNMWVTCLFKDLRMYSWCYIIKRDIYEHIKYPEGRYFEDISTIPSVVIFAKSYRYIPVSLIFYRQREGSIMRQPIPQRDLDMAGAMLYNQHAFEECKGRLDQAAQTTWKALIVQTYSWGVKDLAKKNLLGKGNYRKKCEAIRLNVVRHLGNDIGSALKMLKLEGRKIDYGIAKIALRSPKILQIVVLVAIFFNKNRRSLRRKSK